MSRVGDSHDFSALARAALSRDVVPGNQGVTIMNTIMQPADLARQENSRALEGRVAIITGSTSGNGLGIAQALAAQGAMIVLNGFGEAIEVEKLCRVLGARHDVAVRYDSADMSDPAAITDMVDRTERVFGPVDILVNNAGIQYVAPIEALPPGKWDAIIAINLSTLFHATRAVIEGMKARGWGRILNGASAHGLIG